MVINRKKLVFLLCGILGVLLLLLLFKAILRPRKEQTLTKKPSASTTSKETKSTPPSLEKIRVGRLKSAYPLWGRNPFIPGSLIESSDQLILRGIIWDEAGAFAIINDKIVRKGDEIEGRRVMEIKKDRVIINDGQSNFELKL